MLVPESLEGELDPERQGLELIVDAGQQGNEARFINSVSPTTPAYLRPNCELVTLWVRGILRIIIASTAPIARGSPLILDYNQHANTYFDEKMTEEDKVHWVNEQRQLVGPWVALTWAEQSAQLAPLSRLKRRAQLLDDLTDTALAKRRRLDPPLLPYAGEEPLRVVADLQARVAAYGQGPHSQRNKDLMLLKTWLWVHAHPNNMGRTWLPSGVERTRLYGALKTMHPAMADAWLSLARVFLGPALRELRDLGHAPLLMDLITDPLPPIATWRSGGDAIDQS